MPFMIQVFRDYNDTLASLECLFYHQDKEQAENEAELKAVAVAEKAARFAGVPTLGSEMNAPLALPAPGYGMPRLPPAHYSNPFGGYPGY